MLGGREIKWDGEMSEERRYVYCKMEHADKLIRVKRTGLLAVFGIIMSMLSSCWFILYHYMSRRQAPRISAAVPIWMLVNA